MDIVTDIYINIWTQFYPITVAGYNQVQSQHEQGKIRAY
jgi:hypothetical protein